jgi:activator of HSP90 ATPase
MKTLSIHYETEFPASPLEVYRLLMDPLRHALITESEVKISSKPDGKFEVYGGYCIGYNIELIEGEKIVQAWHFDEDDWPANHFSICTFTFTPSAIGCKMVFEQSEVPEVSFDSLENGWKTYYWDRMREVIGNMRQKDDL